MVLCARIGDVARVEDGVQFDVRTSNGYDPRADLQQIMGANVKVSAPIRVDGPTRRFTASGANLDELEQLLRAVSAPVVLAVSDCDLSVSLDFYKVPTDGVQPTEWPYTETGDLVNAIKYGNRIERLPELSERAITQVLRNPVFSQVSHVVAVPGSGIGYAPPGSLPGKVAASITRRLGANTADLQRTKKPERPQKTFDTDEGADANQHNTMTAYNVEGATVLLVDDTMQNASTINEAVRALRAAGAASVVALCLAKDIRGTKGYRFDE